MSCKQLYRWFLKVIEVGHGAAIHSGLFLFLCFYNKLSTSFEVVCIYLFRCCLVILLL